MLLICACGGGDDGVDPDGGPPIDGDTPIDVIETIDVAGVVLDSAGRPMAGVSVYVEGGAPLVSDQDGEFSVGGVLPPYDVILAHADSDLSFAYQDLTRSDPTFATLFQPDADRAASVTLSVEAGTSTFVSPNPANTITMTQLNGEALGAVQSDPGQAATPVVVDASWNGAATAQTAIHVLQMTYGPGGPVSFSGYGSTNVTLDDGQDEAFEVTMAPATAGALTVEASVADPAMDLTNIQTWMVADDRTMFFLLNTSLTGDEQTVVTVAPQVAAATAAVRASAAVTTGGGPALVFKGDADLPIPTTNLALEIPDVPPPVPTSPPASSEIEVGSELCWTAIPDAVYLALLQPSGGGDVVTAFTADTCVAVPDTAPFGVALAPDTNYQFLVLAVVGVSSTDELTEGSLFLDAFLGRRDAVLALGPSRALTTP
jgi:hypothetical protein